MIRTRRTLATALAVLAMAAGQAGAGASAAVVAGCASRWTILAAARPDRSSQMTSVAVVSAHDVWMAGGTNVGPVFEHWDGAAWSLVEVPSPPDGGSVVGLEAIASDDVWAVGISRSGPFYEHWDGAGWSLVEAPSVPGAELVVELAAASPDDVWAVGTRPGSGRTDPLVEHWDGSGWNVVPVPASAERWERLNGVAAASEEDVWAVGSRAPGDGVFTPTLILHWNGSAWSRVPSPSPAENGPNILASVAALAADDAWAVGTQTSGDRPLIERWDGVRWSVVAGPGEGALAEVAALGPADVRAAGSTQDDRPVVLGWDGSEWSPQPLSPTPKPHARLLALDAGDGRFFAAGYQWSTLGRLVPLVERACPSGG